MSQFTLFYPQDITFSVRAMFRVCEMTALCIRSRIFINIIIIIIIIIIVINICCSFFSVVGEFAH